MDMNFAVVAVTTLALALPGAAQQQTYIPLESVGVERIHSLAPPMGYPAAEALSVVGKPLSIAGSQYEHGVGTFTDSRMEIDVGDGAEDFEATVGVDDAHTPMPKLLPGATLLRGLQTNPGTANFEVWVDGKQVFLSGVLHRGDKPKRLHVDLHGARKLTLIITDNGWFPFDNPSDWADAGIHVSSSAKEMPRALHIPQDPVPIVAHISSSGIAHIHGPSIIGGSPGRPFLYLVPASGTGPLAFSASGLPDGLHLDGRTGIISGVLREPGIGHVRLKVTNSAGASYRTLTIVARENAIALTPPMGWESWNAWARAIDDAKVRQTADEIVSSGLAAHGYSYIEIDDGWEGERDASGRLQPNSRFPDMKKLAAYVHSKGLKLGIYSSPGPLTCQGLPGSYQHEDQDARTFADWGVDLLKYDLCSYNEILKGKDTEAENIKPYRFMGGSLRATQRDIVYMLCQYGNHDVWKWGRDVGGNTWRTGPDIRDSWFSMSKIAFAQSDFSSWAGPGHWNDPDMIVVGKVGWGMELHDSRLTPAEQLTHVTMWAILAAPLILSNDVSQITPFTLDLLTNDEVLEVNQDPIGKEASIVKRDGLLEVWSKPMSDGSIIVGLFNRGIEPATIEVRWSDLKISGSHPVRDLWRQKDLGTSSTAFKTAVLAHGCVLIRIGKLRKTGTASPARQPNAAK